MWLLAINKKAKLIPEAQSVLRLASTPTKSLLQNLGEFSIPAIYPYKSQSTLEEIMEVLGKERVKVRTGDYAKPSNYSSFERRKYYEISLHEYYQELRASQTVGYAGGNLLSSSIIKELAMSYPPLYEAEMYYSPMFWLGPEGCITPLHQDGLDNFAYHLFGNKRWTLIHPKYADKLDVVQPFPMEAPHLFTSSLDLRDDEIAEELRREIPIIDIEVQEGEVLFLPAGWLHFVQTLKTTLMMNLWGHPEKVIPLLAAAPNPSENNPIV